MNIAAWSKTLWWRFIKIALVTGPPAALSIWAFNGWGMEEKGLSALASAYSSWFTALILAPIITNLIGEVFEHWATRRLESKDISQVEFSVLLTAIDSIVDEKAERFGEVLRSLNGQQHPAGEVFRRITDPDRQIRSLLMGMNLSFSNILNSNEFRMVLMAVETGIPKHIVHSVPADARPSEELLSKGTVRKTFFFAVCRSKEPLVIPDIKKHLNKRKPKIPFYCSKGEVAQGSIVGIPVRHPFLDKVTHVITIYSKEPGRFDSKFPRRYRRAIRCFVNRISLEHTLQLLKAHAQPEN